jgi:hypothetical protein
MYGKQDRGGRCADRVVSCLVGDEGVVVRRPQIGGEWDKGLRLVRLPCCVVLPDQPVNEGVNDGVAVETLRCSDVVLRMLRCLDVVWTMLRCLDVVWTMLCCWDVVWTMLRCWNVVWTMLRCLDVVWTMLSSLTATLVTGQLKLLRKIMMLVQPVPGVWDWLQERV